MRPVVQIELCRKRRLVVEKQTIFAPARQIVEPHAYQLQKRFVALQLACFSKGDDSASRQLTPAFADAACARHPQYVLQVAQSSSALLDIGLEIGFLIPGVTLLLLELFSAEESFRIHCVCET